MSQTSGKQNLDLQLDEILDQYEKQNGLNFPTVNEDMSGYLNMSRDYIESLDRDERSLIALRLAQYSLYVQRLINRERARVSFCDATIRNICARDWINYDKYFQYDIRVAAIALENDVISKVLKIKNHAQIRVLDLENVPFSIKHISDILMRSNYGRE
jgi:hypothetical protein